MKLADIYICCSDLQPNHEQSTHLGTNVSKAANNKSWWIYGFGECNKWEIYIVNVIVSVI